MTPGEEQILRNQVAMLGMLSALMVMPNDAGPDDVRKEYMTIQMMLAEAVLKETQRLLLVESEQGRTVHDYTP